MKPATGEQLVRQRVRQQRVIQQSGMSASKIRQRELRSARRERESERAYGTSEVHASTVREGVPGFDGVFNASVANGSAPLKAPRKLQCEQSAADRTESFFVRSCRRQSPSALPGEGPSSLRHFPKLAKSSRENRRDFRSLPIFASAENFPRSTNAYLGSRQCLFGMTNASDKDAIQLPARKFRNSDRLRVLVTKIMRSRKTVENRRPFPSLPSSNYAHVSQKL